MFSYPDQLEIVPLEKPPDVAVRVPGSKSITNRALVLAAIGSAFGQGCDLHGALECEDTEVMVLALQMLGFTVETDWARSCIRVGKSPDPSRRIPARQADLYVANSGTSMRFLTALAAWGQGRYRVHGSPRMSERPIADLITALQQLGINAYCENGDGCPPVIVETDGLRGGTVRIRADTSSQFLSGLLMVAPVATGEVVIEVDGPVVSVPYLQMTVAMMRAFGAEVETDGRTFYRIPGCQRYQRTSFPIEPDASAASYFFAAAAVSGGSVEVPLANDSLTGAVSGPARGKTPLLQGDWEFARLLGEMGCEVQERERADVGAPSARESTGAQWPGIKVSGRPLRGIDVDMNAISDTVMTLAAVACFADGPTTIHNVAHIRHKETDRLAALAAELRKLGAEVEERADGLRITPRPLHAAVIDTYNDHRMAMSMALVGLKVPGIVIRNPGCVAKTYPGFWQDLDKLRPP
jgi:3-phosphoshikimate 1-carboxyvinyltransferase